jgi:DNA-binding CsgD family transcriptional regulator
MVCCDIAARVEVIKLETLESVFGKSTDAVFGISKAGRIRYTNRSFEQLMGYSSGQLCGSSCAKVLCGTYLHGEVFCGPNCPIPKTVSNQPEISDFDIVVRSNDGHSMMVNIGTSYVSSLLQDCSGVDVLFNMRRINPQRLLQRMAAPSSIGVSAKSQLHGSNRLTVREKEILSLAARGMNTAQIAHQLSISTQTVRSHFKNIYQKLGVNSRVEAVVVAMHYRLHHVMPLLS